MKTTTIFTIKVWLSCVFTAPALMLLTSFFNNPENISFFGNLSTVSDYLFFVLVEFCFSIITWLAFIPIVHLIVNSTFSPARQKVSILAIGVGLTITTFIIFFILLDGTWPQMQNSVFLSLVGCHCFPIGISIWLYKLEPTA